MTDLRAVNYRNLKRQFFDSADAKKAAHRIDSATTAAKSRALNVLLRHHDEERVSDADTWKRDEFDELLHFYSVMEIASLLDLIPRTLPEELQKMASRHLRHPAVNRYFVSNYPLVLPQLFALRVGGYMTVRYPNDGSTVPEGTFPLFLQLLQLDSIIHGGDEDVDTLLWFLDGGSTDGYDIDDTLDALKSANTFFRRLSIEPDQMTARDSSLQGLVTFLDFCQELDSFLRTRDLPDLFRYEAWHLYGYWFGNLGSMMGDHLNTAIERVTHWRTESRIGDQQDKKEAVSQLRGAVGRLLSGDYGRLPMDSEALSDLVFVFSQGKLEFARDYIDYPNATAESHEKAIEEFDGEL
jgi:hypothetical protein